MNLKTSKPLHILIFNWRDTKHVYAGGAEVYVHELAKRWVKNGHNVTLFCGNDRTCAHEEVIDGVHIIRKGGFYTVYVWAFIYYVLFLRKKCDVIIDAANGIPFFTPLYSRKKIFLVIHHVHQEVFRKNLHVLFSGLAAFLEKDLMPFVYKYIPVITVSPSSKQEIIEHRLARNEPHIIYNGVDTDRYKPGKKYPTPLIAYVGRLKAYKNLETFIYAAQKIAEKFPETTFVIAGSGEEKKHLSALVQSLKLDTVISFAGFITEQEKVALYQKAWIIVNPSSYEGWGITTIEANACGTPVVASDVAGLKDSVQHGENGFLAKHGSVEEFYTCIVKLVEDTELRKTMSHTAQTYAQRFNWDRSATQFLDIMRKEYET